MAVSLPLLLAATLIANPARVAGGKEASVSLQIAAAPDASLTFWASSGTISAPVPASAGRWTARYQPSPERFPRVALLLVTARSAAGEERAWLALPIEGRETLTLSTKESSRVEVWIAGVKFGPVSSDSTGRAQIAVTVPPGVGTAQVRVRDPFGNKTAADLPLRPPPFQRLRILASSAGASWTDSAPVSLEIFAVDASGRPAHRRDLSVAADRGELGALAERRPGLFVVPYRAPAKYQSREARIQARLAGDSSGPTTLTLALSPGPPARIELRASATSVLPGGSVLLDAAVVDGNGNPRLEDPLDFESDLGTVSAASARTAQLRAPDPFAARSFVHVTARAGSLSADLPIALQPPPQLPPPLASAEKNIFYGTSAGGWLLGQHNLSRAASAGLEVEVAAHAGRPWAELFARGIALQFAPVRAPIDGSSRERASLQGLGAQAGGRVLLPLRSGWALHASLGVGVVRTMGTLRVEGGPASAISESTARWVPALSGGVGGSLRLPGGRLLGELQLASLPSRGAVQGNLGGLWLRIGWLFNLR